MWRESFGKEQKILFAKLFAMEKSKEGCLKGGGAGIWESKSGNQEVQTTSPFSSPPPPLPSVWRLTLCFLGSVTKQSRAAFISQSGQTSKFPSTNQDQKRHKTKLNTDLAHAHFPALGIGCMPFKSVVTGLSDLVFWHYHSHQKYALNYVSSPPARERNSSVLLFSLSFHSYSL